MNPSITQYIESIKRICPEVKDEELIKLRAQLYVREYKAKELIFACDKIQTEVCFIAKGLVRCYHVNNNNIDQTLWFIVKNRFATDYPAFIGSEVSKFCFEALEDTSAVHIPKDAIFAAFDEFPSMQKYGRLVTEKFIKMEQKRIEGLQFKTPEERYLDLLKDPNNLVNRVPLGHIASSIAISRQSLTRIRKKLLLKNDSNESSKIHKKQ